MRGYVVSIVFDIQEEVAFPKASINMIKSRTVGILLLAFCAILLVVIAGKLLFFSADDSVEAGVQSTPSVIWESPTENQEVSGTDGASVIGTVGDISSDTLWLFDVAESPTVANKQVYYLSSERPIATSNTRFNALDKPIGSGATDVGATFTLALVRASTTCTAVLENAKPDANGSIVFDVLPEGCREIATRHVKKISP